MSRGPWKRDPLTGIPLATLAQLDEAQLAADGSLNIELPSDCNLFCVNSIAALCGFRDAGYFRDEVLTRLDCPIRVRMIELTTAESRRVVATIYATHTNSALAGGEKWHAVVQAAVRQRATGVNSGQLL